MARRGRRSTVRGWVGAVAATTAVLVAGAAGSGVAGAAPGATTSSGVQTRGLAGADGTIGHHGRWLTDAKGRVVLLHGLNLVAKGKQTPAQEGFDAADVTWLVHHGFDVVRLGLTAAAAMPTPGHLDRAWLTSFEGTVHQLTSQGVLVLIDLHQDGWGPTLGSDGFPGWMTVTGGAENTHTPFPNYYIDNPAIQAAFQSFWENKDGPGGTPLQSSVATIFKALATAEARNPGVVGYDLINEPWPGPSYLSCLSGPDGCPQLTADELDPYDARMAKAIRTVDHHHLLFGEPFTLFNFGLAPTQLALPGNDPESGMSFHMYTATPSAEPSLIANAEQWSAITGGALLDTEFGATTVASDADRQIDELDGALIPWIWWTFDENVVKDLHKAPTASNVRGSLVSALVRPHPVLVAGTPTAQHYDEATRTLTFSYRTIGPTGKTFGSSTPTEIEVPASVYPSGWKADVTGGTGVKGAPRGVFEAVASPGASSVTVTVGPAA